MLGMERTTSAQYYASARKSWRFVLPFTADPAPLNRQDVALVRVGRGLQERIEKEGEAAGLKAQVKLWAGAWEVEELFPQL